MGNGSDLIDWAIRWALAIGGVGLVAYVIVASPDAVFDLFRDRRGTARQTEGAPRPAAGDRELIIQASQGGHFLVEADLNGTSVLFLIDTGARALVLTPADAARVGIHVSDRDFTQRVRTANGVVRAAPMRLDSLRIGQLWVTDLEAWVNEAPMGISLLGMTFLQRLGSYEVRDGTLYLRW